ncbi:MAG: hypothetical protein V8T09_05480 [Oscillospiraceae bacterium]
MDAMKPSTKPLNPFETAKPLEEYKLVIVGSPVWAGRMASPIRSLLKRRGLELHRVAYVVTRSTDQRSEEVYDQMDLYTAEKRLFAVSLRPGSEGYEFWRNDFISECPALAGAELRTRHAGEAESYRGSSGGGRAPAVRSHGIY